MSKWVKRVLSVVLVCILIGGVLPMATIFTRAATGYGSNGKFLIPIEPPVAGSIAVSTRAQLDAIRNNRDGNYHLTKDIDLSGAEWEPIESYGGIFDGQGYVIRNLKITGVTDGYSGLFGDSYSTPLIKNVGMEGTNINITSTYASAGSVYAGHVLYGPTIINCYNTGNIHATGTSVEGGGLLQGAVKHTVHVLDGLGR